MIPALLVFLVVVGGPALAVAARLRAGEPAARLALGAAAAFVFLYLAAWLVYVSGLPWVTIAVVPAAGLALLARERAAGRALLADPIARAGLAGWAALAAWCLGWQALVLSYSGAGWSLDWIEHYDRARFFLQRLPLDHVFIGRNLLPARPPLANLATAGLLALAGDGFDRYQVVTTLLASLVFLPLAALTQLRGPDQRALRLLAVVAMLNPMLVQNATFPWTKLPAAFFVLVAVLLLVRAARGGTGLGAAGVALAAGLLTHYSVAPWVLAFAAGALAWRAWPARPPGFRRELLAGAGAAAILLATWFGWAALRFGPALLARATSTLDLAPHVTPAGQAWIALTNLRNTLVPDWSAPFFDYLMRQQEFAGRLRDMLFCLYQLNLFASFGVGTLAVLVWRALRAPAGPERRFWLVAVPVALAVGCAVHTMPAELGLAHIALTPLTLLGLAWAAGAGDGIPRALALVWAAGLLVDLVLGIALQFGIESLALLRWLHPGLADPELIARLNPIAISTYGDKQWLRQPFLGDALGTGGRAAVGLALACLLAGAVARWHRSRRKMASPGTAGAA